MKKIMFLVLLFFVACNDGADNDGLDDGKKTDEGDDDVECNPTAEWGTGFTVGASVANWSMNGFFDGDKDGEVDESAADFTLEDAFCHGKKSIVIAVSDANCQPCSQWYGELAATTFLDDIHAQNSALLMFYSHNLGGAPGTAEECYEYFSEHYNFEPGYYVGGPPTLFQFGFFPYMAVIDLTTGELLAKDEMNDFLSAEAILQLVTEVNGN